MAGLLDVLNSDQGRMALGLLAAAGPRSDGAGFGQRLNEGMGSFDAYKQNALKQKMLEAQMQQAMEHAAQQKAERARQQTIQQGMGQFFKPGQAAQLATAPVKGFTSIDSMLPPEMQIGSPGRAAMPAVAPSFDTAGAAQFLAQNGEYEKAIPMYESLKPKVEKLKKGEAVFVGGKKAYDNPDVPELPTTVREFQYAQENPLFTPWMLQGKRAGATNITTKIENKTGESLAGQVGPMAKDSRIQTQGAVKMYDAADRLERAIDSNKVTSGPFASQVQTVKQLVQVVGGGNDESIRQTRQAIKSLAQMSVEARKQLQGQGQVTESEAAAVAKADSGDINDLTTGELRDLVTLTKRAAHYQAKSHQDLLGTLSSKDETRSLVPFYNVQGLDPILKYKPTLPTIGGGGWGIKQVGQ